MGGILVIGAHAMDAEVMAGGIAAAAALKGQRVILFHLTRGERGHPKKSAETFSKQLEKEMEVAADILNVTQEWAGFLAPLPSPAKVAPVVAGAINHWQADTVITHWKGSWHRSHVRAHEAVSMAVNSIGRSVSLFYAENCEDLTGFQPDQFVPIKNIYESWLTALRTYELFRLSVPGSQGSSSIPYWAYYTAAARVRGLQADLEYAQALMTGSGYIPPYLQARAATLASSAS